MMNKTPLLLLAGISLLASCKKDEDCQPNVTNNTTQVYCNNPTDFYQLKPGNYWIYERFQIDASGIPTSLGLFDSCYIEKDTLINGKSYSKYMSSKVDDPSPVASYQNPISATFYRDSSGYLVTLAGKVEFAWQDFGTLFESAYLTISPGDTLAHLTARMADENFPYNTPLGIYTTSSYKETYMMYAPYTLGGTVRYRNTRYADHVGKVTESFRFFANSPINWERRLVRYHLN